MSSVAESTWVEIDKRGAQQFVYVHCSLPHGPNWSHQAPSVFDTKMFTVFQVKSTMLSLVNPTLSPLIFAPTVPMQQLSIRCPLFRCTLNGPMF